MKNLFNICLFFTSVLGFSQTTSTIELENLIVLGDSLLQEKNYSGALNAFKKAGEINLSDSICERMHRTQHFIIAEDSCGNNCLVYSKIVIEADKLFEQSKYEKSKEYYKRALLFRPNDQHVLKRLDKIDVKIKNAK